MGKQVFFAGIVPENELTAYYAASDIFLLPNRVHEGDIEGFGIVFLEAAASGKPVIGGNSGGVPEAVQRDVTGLLVDGSVDEVVKAIRRLATSERSGNDLAWRAGSARWGYSAGSGRLRGIDSATAPDLDQRLALVSDATLDPCPVHSDPGLFHGPAGSIPRAPDVPLVCVLQAARLDLDRHLEPAPVARVWSRARRPRHLQRHLAKPDASAEHRERAVPGHGSHRALNAVDHAQSWYWLDFLTRLILICLFTVSLVTTKQRLIWVLAVVAGSFGFHAGKAGVASLAGGGLRFADGLTGAFADNNGYAMGTVMVIPLLLAVALNAHLLLDDPKAWQTKWIRRGFYAAIPACAFTVVSTFSRGGFLGLAAALLFYVALHQKRVRLSMAGAALVVLGLTFAPIPDGYFDRLETITNYEEIGEESAMSRYALLGSRHRDGR